jgi:hypothetical protein
MARSGRARVCFDRPSSARTDKSRARQARKSSLESEYGDDGNENEILRAFCFNLRRSWRGGLRRLLRRLPRLWRLLWSKAVLRRRLSGGRRRGSTLLSRSWVLVWSHVLCVEAGPLGVAERTESLEARPLRRARILKKCFTTCCSHRPVADPSRRCLFKTPYRAVASRQPGFLVFKRSAEPTPSVPNENAQPWPGSLIRSARFYGN